MTAQAPDDTRSTKPVRIPSLRPPTGPVPVPSLPETGLDAEALRADPGLER